MPSSSVFLRLFFSVVYTFLRGGLFVSSPPLIYSGPAYLDHSSLDQEWKAHPCWAKQVLCPRDGQMELKIAQKSLWTAET